MRESLSWPFARPLSDSWAPIPTASELYLGGNDVSPSQIIVRQLDGISARDDSGEPQTLISGTTQPGALPALWLGISGSEQQITLLLAPQPGRSPHRWTGPPLHPGRRFSIQIAFHPEMGAGGLLWRWSDKTPWSSLIGASPWGVERLMTLTNWTIGHGQRGLTDQPFRGSELGVRGTTAQT